MPHLQFVQTYETNQHSFFSIQGNKVIQENFYINEKLCYCTITAIFIKVKKNKKQSFIDEEIKKLLPQMQQLLKKEL